MMQNLLSHGGFIALSPPRFSEGNPDLPPEVDAKTSRRAIVRIGFVSPRP